MHADFVCEKQKRGPSGSSGGVHSRCGGHLSRILASLDAGFFHRVLRRWVCECVSKCGVFRDYLDNPVCVESGQRGDSSVLWMLSKNKKTGVIGCIIWDAMFIDKKLGVTFLLTNYMIETAPGLLFRETTP